MVITDFLAQFTELFCDYLVAIRLHVHIKKTYKFRGRTLTDGNIGCLQCVPAFSVYVQCATAQSALQGQ